jgi:hypothetical protein
MSISPSITSNKERKIAFLEINLLPCVAYSSIYAIMELPGYDLD